MTQAERVRLRLGSHCSVLSTLFNPMDCTWAPLSMGFSQQVYWSGLPFPSLGDLPDPGIEPTSPVSPILTGRFFYRWAIWQAPRVGCRDWYSSSLAPNKHKCGNFQQQPNMNSQSCRSEAWWSQLYPLLRVSLSRNLCGVACLPFWGPWKKTCFWAHSGHEQNSVPCSCKVGSCFLVDCHLYTGFCSQRPPASPPIFPNTIFQEPWVKLRNFLIYPSPASLWWTHLLSSSTCKGSCVCPGLTWIIHDLILTLKAADEQH